MNFSKMLIVLSSFISLNIFASDGMSMMHRHHDQCGYIECPRTCGNTRGCEWVHTRHGDGYCTESYRHNDYCEDIGNRHRCYNTDGCRWSDRRGCVSDRHHR